MGDRQNVVEATRYRLESAVDRLEFVTVEGLLAYGEMLARRTAGEGIALPPIPPSSVDRLQRTRDAMEKIRAFVQRAQGGFPGAEEYRATRRAVIEEGCRGDELVFFAAWNALLAAGELAPLFRVPIGSVQKPTHRRPVAIVPRAQLTPQLVEDRIVLDLGEDRFWLLPRDLTGRTLLFTMRHGISRVESGTYRVGRRLANVLDPERGVPKADAVGAALARMLGVVGQQLDFLHIHNYLDPRTFVHRVSQSPNTRQLYERVIAALMQAHHAEALPPACDPALDSQDFGWVTGLEKKVEAEEAAKAFGVDVQTAKRLIKHPLYSYPGGHSFFDVYADIVDGFRRLGQSHQGKAVCVYSHSSTLRALMIYLDPRPFREAFTEFGEYKEGQDNVVLLTYEQGLLSGYSTAVGLSARERTARGDLGEGRARTQRPDHAQAPTDQADRGIGLGWRFRRCRRRIERTARDRTPVWPGSPLRPSRVLRSGQQLDRSGDRAQYPRYGQPCEQSDREQPIRRF